MAQVKEQNPAQAQNNPNRNSESGGEKRTRWAVWVKWART